LPEQLTVLFRDEHIVVIDKPPGLLVHRSGIGRHETRFTIHIGQRVWAGSTGHALFTLNNELAGAHGPAIHGRYGGKTLLGGHPRPSS
jgi:tRNA pseudouridine65 synthase